MKTVESPPLSRPQPTWPVIWAAWGLLALVFYVASIGPAARLYDSGLLPETAESILEILYLPIHSIAEWAGEENPAVKLLLQYLEWWLG